MSRLRCLLASTALLCAVSGCESRVPPRPETWAPAPTPTHQPRPVPKGSFEGAQGSLLDDHASRPPRDSAETATWRLPTNAKTIIVELLIGVGSDNPERVAELLTGVARWGVPDRREIHARPIVTKDDPLGLEFITALRQAAARMAAKASFSCTPLQPNWGLLADSGAEPMWCSYASEDGLDLIVFRLMKEGGELRVDYVGLFEDRPTGPIFLANGGLAPPITPYTKVPVDLSPNVKGKAKARSTPAPADVGDSGEADEAEAAPIQVRPPEQAPIPVKPD